MSTIGVEEDFAQTMSEIPSLPQAPEPHPEIAARFSDLHPLWNRQAATMEADRCLFCFDAPCANACPTHIDVPRFIRRIAEGNLRGAAHTILDANILGASCARACPVEVLCEGACVMHHGQQQPIQIGRLQQYAMESFYASGAELPFMPGPATGSSVALMGAGPASLACAAELRRRGIQAHLYDARPLPGGLNTYGVAEYKLSLSASVQEIAMLAQLGVIFHGNTFVNDNMLVELMQQHDAIFLGIGLGGDRHLDIAGETLPGVVRALDLIAAYKSGQCTTVPSRVVVIGAGNTAIDAAIASIRLGAEQVHIAYRQGPEQMPAFASEYRHAQREGVRFLWHVHPHRIAGNTQVEGMELSHDEEDGVFLLPAEMIVLAIGQDKNLLPLLSEQKIATDEGCILVNRATGQTSNPYFFAGGDCVNGGREVVDAVADGKRAAHGIAAWLEARHD